MLAPAMVDSLVSCAVSFLAGTALCVCGWPFLRCGSSLISCLLCAFDFASSYLTQPCTTCPGTMQDSGRPNSLGSVLDKTPRSTHRRFLRPRFATTLVLLTARAR